MSSKLCIIVGALICISSGAQAEDLEAKFYKEIATRAGLKVEGLSNSDIFPREIPDGLSLKDMTPSCDPRRFEESVVGKKLTNRQYYGAAKRYFEKCGTELSSKGASGLMGLLKSSYVEYSFLERPEIKEVKITLRDGTVLPAIVALRTDPRPRPFVILRCGVFCSAQPAASLKTYLMSLFDQSPFNVIIVASQTGEDYITTNGKVTLGGWAEGYETWELGKWLVEKSDFRDRISSMHLIGVSLGGNTAVMGAAYNDRYSLDSGRKLFNSVTGLCPVVSLRPTLEHLYANGVVGIAFSKMTRDQFRKTQHAVKDVPELLTEDKIPWTPYGMTKFIGTVASAALSKRGIANTPDSFFKNNNFWNLKEEVKTPLMLWASKDDPVVNTDINSEVVEGSRLYEKSENVGVLKVPYGSHCAFSTAYGHQAFAAVLRTFILNNSPEFLDTYESKQEQAWTFGFEKMSRDIEHVSQKWKFAANSNRARIDFKVFLRKADASCSAGPWKTASALCFQTKTRWVSIASLKNLGARIPTTDAEAQALSREFNTKVEFRVKTGPLSGTNKTDFFMTWRNHFE